MVRPILRLGADVLCHPARPVAHLGDELRSLVRDMADTMYASKGIGLAAPQIGVDARVFVVDLTGPERASDLHVFVNPSFVSREGMQLGEEGCLSVPGFDATVARAARVVLRAQDLDGGWHTVEATRLLARAFEHEMDHLDGRLFVDRLKPLSRAHIVGRIERLSRTGRW